MNDTGHDQHTPGEWSFTTLTTPNAEFRHLLRGTHPTTGRPRTVAALQWPGNEAEFNANRDLLLHAREMLEFMQDMHAELWASGTLDNEEFFERADDLLARMNARRTS